MDTTVEAPLRAVSSASPACHELVTALLSNSIEDTARAAEAMHRHLAHELLAAMAERGDLSASALLLEELARLPREVSAMAGSARLEQSLNGIRRLVQMLSSRCAAPYAHHQLGLTRHAIGRLAVVEGQLALRLCSLHAQGDTLVTLLLRDLLEHLPFTVRTHPATNALRARVEFVTEVLEEFLGRQRV